MACAGCKGPKGNSLVLTPESYAYEAPMMKMVTPTAESMETPHGREMLSQPLVTVVPRDGWSVRYSLNGVTQSLPAAGTALHAINQLAARIRLNGGVVDMLTLWFLANRQWMARTAAANHKVDFKKFLALAPPETAPPPAQERGGVETETQKHGPAEWGRIAWMWLGLELARNDFSPERFRGIAEQIRIMLDPECNLGCKECFDEWTRLTETIPDDGPVHDFREWLWNVRNGVNTRIGKRHFTFTEAAKANLWR